MKSKIKEVLKKRINKDEDSYAVVGIEIKNRRISLSRTLNGVSYKICSVSYLSKIENNKILPNRYFVKEICTRLELSDEKIETLLNLKRILEDSVIAFFNKDLKLLQKFKDDGLGLNNYRYRLVHLICSIAESDLYTANRLYFDLLPLATSMTDFDLIVFGLFSGILHFYNFEFDDALEDLEMLIGFEALNEVKLLRDLYIFYCYYAQNRGDTVFEYQVISSKLIKQGLYELLDYVHYIMGIYLVKNKSNRELKNILMQIRNHKYKTSLGFLKKYFNNERIKQDDYSDKNLSKYCLLLKGILFNKKSVIEEITSLNDMVYRLDLDAILLKYNLLNTIEEKIDYIDEIVLPKLLKTKEGFLIDYFLQQYSILCTRIGRYKCFSEMFLNLKKLRLL